MLTIHNASNEMLKKVRKSSNRRILRVSKMLPAKNDNELRYISDVYKAHKAILVEMALRGMNEEL